MSHAPGAPAGRRTWRMRGWAKVEILLDGEHERFIWLDHGDRGPRVTDRVTDSNDDL